MLLVKIPHRLALQKNCVSMLLRRNGGYIPCFELKSQEQEFCSQLLQHHKNWWLYRCNQKKSIGDFVMVDMSAPVKVFRQVWILELKFCHEFQYKKGFQLRNAQLAIQELIAQQLIVPETPVEYVHCAGKILLSRLQEHKNR